MTNKRNFWLALMAATLLFWLAALTVFLTEQTLQRIVIVALIVLGLHLLEIPIAFRVLRARRPQPLRLIVATLLFGVLWLAPARRGLVAVS